MGTYINVCLPFSLKWPIHSSSREATEELQALAVGGIKEQGQLLQGIIRLSVR